MVHHDNRSRRLFPVLFCSFHAEVNRVDSEPNLRIDCNLSCTELDFCNSGPAQEHRQTSVQKVNLHGMPSDYLACQLSTNSQEYAEAIQHDSGENGYGFLNAQKKTHDRLRLNR